MCVWCVLCVCVWCVCGFSLKHLPSIFNKSPRLYKAFLSAWSSVDESNKIDKIKKLSQLVWNSIFSKCLILVKIVHFFSSFLKNSLKIALVAEKGRVGLVFLLLSSASLTLLGMDVQALSTSAVVNGGQNRGALCRHGHSWVRGGPPCISMAG